MEPDQPPAAFRGAIESLRAAQVRPEVMVAEVPAPQRIAPFAHAVTADVVTGGDGIADGRLVVLHDPAGQEAWEGPTRIVAYARAALDAEMAADPLLGQVAWSWLVEAFDSYGAGYAAAGGTVTRTASSRFGTMADEADTAEVELRASWSPRGEDLRPHLLAWCDLLCSTAGLPPPGVAPLPGRRAR